MQFNILHLERSNVYITSQYFLPAIIYRDIISHITSTFRYIMYFFRTFKKSTAPYKVHNMGLRYIKILRAPRYPGADSAENTKTYREHHETPGKWECRLEEAKWRHLVSSSDFKLFFSFAIFSKVTSLLGNVIKVGIFIFIYFLVYIVQHCFICRPQIPLCRRMLGSGHCYEGHIFLVSLPFSFILHYAATPWWLTTLHSQNKSYRGTIMVNC